MKNYWSKWLARTVFSLCTSGPVLVVGLASTVVWAASVSDHQYLDRSKTPQKVELYVFDNVGSATPSKFGSFDTKQACEVTAYSLNLPQRGILYRCFDNSVTATPTVKPKQ